MLRVATDPDGFFRDLDPGPVGPAVVVLLVGVPVAGVGVMDALVTGAGLRAAARRGLVQVAGAVGLWVGTAVLLQLTSWVVGGSGSYWDTLRYVGYGFLPAVVSSVLKFAVAVAVALTGGPVASDPLVGTFDAGPTAAAFLLWNGLLWTFGLREARDLSLRDALVAVGVPVGILVVAQASLVVR